MMWTYEQSSGKLLLDGKLVGIGYSGHGLGRNNPGLEDVKNVGPIPAGAYSIGEAYAHPQKGPIVMRLTPDASNEMHGRSGFLIHGNNSTDDASQGCIILGHDIRAQIAASDVKQIEVIR